LELQKQKKFFLKKHDLSPELSEHSSSNSSSTTQSKKKKKKVTKNKTAHKTDEIVKVKHKIPYSQLPILNDIKSYILIRKQYSLIAK
jgi:hypothetical protein